MLEETGTVIEADANWLVVETQPRSACSHCGTGSCSTSVVAKLFGARRNCLRMANHLHARPGQQVVIGIPDRVLVAVSLRAYLVPLLAMLGAAALASGLQMGEAAQALFAIGGLFAGLAWMGRAGQVGRARYAPQLLRLAAGPVVQIDTTALTRSTS